MTRSNKRTVYLARQPDYEEPGLSQCIAALLAQATRDRNLCGTKVLLKPNLLTASNCTLACTDARFILAATHWFLDAGAQVAVGDSPAFGSAETVLHATGILPTLRNSGVRVAEFTKRRPVTLAHGIKVGLAVEALDCDLFVNLPKIKAHPQTRVTMAVKNHFGCVSGFQKPLHHMIHGDRNGVFFDLIASIPAQLPESIQLVDGITAMHIFGPTWGKPFPLGCVAAGINPFAVDTALLTIVGLPHEQSPLWLAGKRLGMEGGCLEELELDWELLAALKARNMVIPEVLLSVRFNPARFLKNSLRRFWLKVLGK